MTDKPQGKVLPFPNGRAPTKNGVCVKEEGNVVIADVTTSFNIPSDRVLHGAMGLFKNVIVIGEDEEGMLHYCVSCPRDAENLWKIEKIKQWILNRTVDE